MKKLFVFKDLSQVSDRYHCGGGLVVIAPSEEDARGMLELTEYVSVSDLEWERVKVFDVDSPTNHVWVFPDAGCC